MMTSVLFARVKVDNQINMYNGCGKKLLNPALSFGELTSAQWQPYPNGVFKKPNIQGMQRAAAEEEAKRPKRTFQMPGTGSAFS